MPSHVVDETEPYVAANGHEMVAPIYEVERPCTCPVDENGEPPHWGQCPLTYAHQFTIWSEAWCTDDCRACKEGEPLPDW